MGWLDVAAEPVIVSVPDHDDGRYWVLHTMDMGHYTTSLFGKRTSGPKGGRFMFANQTWKGEVPDGITELVRVESNFIKLMGRVMATGADDERKALSYVDGGHGAVRQHEVHALQPGVALGTTGTSSLCPSSWEKPGRNPRSASSCPGSPGWQVSCAGSAETEKVIPCPADGLFPFASGVGRKVRVV